MTGVAQKTSLLIDGVEVFSYVGPLSPEQAQLAVSLTILKELRQMAQISDQALADLQTAAAANAQRDAELSGKVDLLNGKVDAAAQLIADLKAAIAANSTSADAALAAVTTLLNGATAQSIASAAAVDTAEGKLDAAVAPTP